MKRGSVRRRYLSFDVSGRIGRLMFERRESIRSFAAALGVAPNSVSRWKRPPGPGHSNMHERILCRVFVVYGPREAVGLLDPVLGVVVLGVIVAALERWPQASPLELFELSMAAVRNQRLAMLCGKPGSREEATAHA